MKITIIIIFTLLINNLNGQTRTIKGRVVSELLEELPGVHILDINNVRIGETDFNGNFEIIIQQETQKLFFSWFEMEQTEIKLQNDCNIVEVVMMYSGSYNFMSSSKIDRLRKKRFTQLPYIHSNAVKKGIFSTNTICYEREFRPEKKTLDSIDKELKLKRKHLKRIFKKLLIGDTIRIPYAGTWKYDKTERTTLHSYSYVVDGENFDCIINGVITQKNKRKDGFNIVYRIIDTKNCSFKNIIIGDKELKFGELIEHNMKYFKIL